MSDRVLSPLEQAEEKYAKKAGKGSPRRTALQKSRDEISDRLKANKYSGGDADKKRRNDEERLRNVDSQLRSLGRGAYGAANRRISPSWGTRAAGMRKGAVQGNQILTGKKKANRDMLRQQFGFEPLKDAGFLEDDPILDKNLEDTGRVRGYKTAEEYQGYRFGPSGTETSWSRSARLLGAGATGGRHLSAIQGMSVKEVMNFFDSLSSDELIRVQHEMMMAGLYGEGKPMLGFRDPSTMKAVSKLLTVWGFEPEMGITELLDRLKKENNLQPDKDMMGGDTSGIGTVSDMVKTATITDAATLDGVIDEVSQELFGEWLPPERKQALIEKLQSQEKSYATSVTAAEDAREASNPAKQTELDHFMDALIGQESGGDAGAVNARTRASGLGQILPDNWGPWARDAGVDPSDYSEKNQRAVIRHQLGKYYAAYGNWRDVAYAWYGGGGAPSKLAAGEWSKTVGQGPRQDEPSFDEYAAGVLDRMKSYQAAGGGGVSGARQPTRLDFVESQADARTRATAELKAADPQRYFGTQFEKQAQNFFELLGGVKF